MGAAVERVSVSVGTNGVLMGNPSTNLFIANSNALNAVVNSVGGAATNAISIVMSNGTIVYNPATKINFKPGTNTTIRVENGGASQADILIDATGGGGGGAETNANYLLYGNTNANLPNGRTIGVAGILSLSTNGTNIVLTGTEVGTVTDAQLANGTNSVKTYSDNQIASYSNRVSTLLQNGTNSVKTYADNQIATYSNTVSTLLQNGTNSAKAYADNQIATHSNNVTSAITTRQVGSANLTNWSNYDPSTVLGSFISPNFLPTPTPPSAISSNRYDSFGTIGLFPSGHYVIAYRSGTDHVGTLDGTIKIRKSLDHGWTWQPETTVLSEPGVDLRNVGGGITFGGRMVLTYSAYTNSFRNMAYIYSEDEGLTWTSPTNIDHLTNTAYSCYGNMIQIGSGEMLTSWYGYNTNGASVYYTSYVIHSYDDGRSWSNAIPVITGVSTGGSGNRYTEASYVYLGGSKILGLVRREPYTYGEGWYFRQVLSIDNGYTWSDMGDATNAPGWFGNPGPAWLCTAMPSEGRRIAIAYYQDRNSSASNRKLKTTWGYADELVSTVNGWQTNFVQVIGYFTNFTSGYPSFIHPYNSTVGFGWFYNELTTNTTKIEFVCASPKGFGSVYAHTNGQVGVLKIPTAASSYALDVNGGVQSSGTVRGNALLSDSTITAADSGTIGSSTRSKFQFPAERRLKIMSGSGYGLDQITFGLEVNTNVALNMVNERVSVVTGTNYTGINPIVSFDPINSINNIGRTNGQSSNYLYGATFQGTNQVRAIKNLTNITATVESDGNISLTASASGGGSTYQGITNLLAADGSNIWINAGPLTNVCGVHGTITLTNNFILNAPTNALFDGQIVRLRIIQDSTGGRTLTTNGTATAYFKFGSDITGITVTTNANAIDYVSLAWYTNGAWHPVSFIRGY